MQCCRRRPRTAARSARRSVWRSALASVKRTAMLFSSGREAGRRLLAACRRRTAARRAAGPPCRRPRIAAQQRVVRDAVGHDHGDVALDRLEARHRLRRPARWRASTASRSSSNSTGACGSSQCWRQRGCSSPTTPIVAAVDAHARAAARMHARDARPARTSRVQRRQQRLDVALDVEEVAPAAPCAPTAGRRRRRRPGPPRASAGARRAPWCRSSRRAASRRNTRPISNTRTRSALRSRLNLQHLQQRAEQRRAHHAHLAGDRVQQLDRVGVAGEVLLPALLDEAEVDRLLVAQRGQQAAHREAAAARLPAAAWP